ncbi:hypothetical protein [Actinoalloteichus hymeniacidonis]|uniref:Uncharacterized protein n=1 Tax=Actinoalloteichus hymeniacidonis TaxID=340345 RepID=A0AAC9HT81_9PSEU|nr:hypothetical protein [Actinoalloteichus hymeniacidonis]AOS65003.1 hypothetical protein TL08_21065 [Actinoalloteichus hymeniacidonis]MBB5906920.1 hypothetical protein [Actinoalloteichus hymeniacidonis]
MNIVETANAAAIDADAFAKTTRFSSRLVTAEEAHAIVSSLAGMTDSIESVTKSLRRMARSHSGDPDTPAEVAEAWKDLAFALRLPSASYAHRIQESAVPRSNDLVAVAKAARRRR